MTLQPTDARQALTTRRDEAEKAPATSLRRDIERMMPEFQRAMPQGAEATQLVRDAITVLNKTPKLARCDTQSVLGALMTCAQLGLRPAVLGEAFVLPFWDRSFNDKRGGYRAQMIVGYPGYIRLALESQLVQSIIPRVVYEKDVFDVDYGVADTLVHKPGRGLRGKATDYYAVARFATGGYAFWTMNLAEMELHRDKHATTRDRDGKIFGPWVDDFDAMGSKTTIRMLAKYIPRTPRLAVARIVDGGLRVDLSPDSDPAQVTQPVTVDGSVADDDVDPFAPGALLTEEQRVCIMTLAKRMGHTDREARIAYYREVTGNREIETTTKLTGHEATLIIGAYERWSAQAEPPA